MKKTLKRLYRRSQFDGEKFFYSHSFITRKFIIMFCHHERRYIVDSHQLRYRTIFVINISHGLNILNVNCVICMSIIGDDMMIFSGKNYDIDKKKRFY